MRVPNRQNKLILINFFLLIFCSLSLQSVCSKDKPIEVIYWRHNNPPEIDAMKKLIERFHVLHKEIKITLRTFPYAAYTTKVVATIATGEGPDIINIHNSWAYGYIKGGLIVPIPEEILAGKTLKKDFFPILKSFSQHGLYYGLPIGGSNLALFYNKRLFREVNLDAENPPKTWDELLKYGELLSKRETTTQKILRSGAAIGLPNGQGWNYFIEGVLRQAGVPIISSDHKRVMWNNADGAAALKWYMGFIKERKVYSHLLPQPYDCFRLNLTAMMINGSWALGNLEKVLDDHAYKQIGIAPLPVSSKNIRATYGTLWGNCVTRTATEKKQKAAWKFIKFITTYENMKYWARSTGEIPMRRVVLLDEEFKNKDKKLIPFIEQMEYAHSSVKKDEKMYQGAITEALEQIIYNDMTPEKALNRAARTINLMLEKR
ncbi:ABC transporter substrate-binding protein [Candidatus Riflebacteria bacterium]